MEQPHKAKGAATLEPKAGWPGRKSWPPTMKEETLDREAGRNLLASFKNNIDCWLKESFKECKVHSVESKENTRSIKGNTLILDTVREIQ